MTIEERIKRMKPRSELLEEWFDKVTELLHDVHIRIHDMADDGELTALSSEAEQLLKRAIGSDWRRFL